MKESFIHTNKVTIIMPDTSEITLSFEEFEVSIVAGIKKRGYPIDRTQYRTNAILGYYNKYVIKFVGSENDL